MFPSHHVSREERRACGIEFIPSSTVRLFLMRSATWLFSLPLEPAEGLCSDKQMTRDKVSTEPPWPVQRLRKSTVGWCTSRVVPDSGAARFCKFHSLFQTDVEIAAFVDVAKLWIAASGGSGEIMRQERCLVHTTVGKRGSRLSSNNEIIKNP